MGQAFAKTNRGCGGRAWLAIACAFLAACGGDEPASDAGAGVPDGRDAADEGEASDASGSANDASHQHDASGSANDASGSANDASISDILWDAPVERDVQGTVDVGLDVSTDGNDAPSNRDGGGNTGMDIAACMATVRPARRLERALYLVLKNSMSMSMTDMQQTMTRWAALREATTLFVNDVSNEGLRVGVDFFPEVADAGVLCAPSDYLAPAVPIAALGSMSTQGGAIAAALAARTPAGTSAVVPALTAAFQYATEWSNAQIPAPAPIDVVLVVDGTHTGCVANNNTMAGTATAAQAAYVGTPSVKTHVLTMGANPGNWESVAAAGGTMQTVHVPDSTGPAIAAGLRTVRARSASCEVALDGVQDLTLVNFEVRDADGGVTMLRRANDPASCGTAQGWYYRDPGQPKSAVLCPAPCAALDAGASVSLLLGCHTVILPP